MNNKAKSMLYLINSYLQSMADTENPYMVIPYLTSASYSMCPFKIRMYSTEILETVRYEIEIFPVILTHLHS